MKMIKLVFTITMLLQGAIAFSQSVSPDSAKYHEGSLTTICGKVYGTHAGQNGILKLNFGADYPDNTFTAVVFADDASKFKKAEEYKGKEICVTGKIQIYKGKAEVVLKEANQLREQ
jgi:DNA/RNA endonuclease YhcR with UshA esterase domain